MHDDVDPAVGQRGAHRRDEDAGAADRGQRPGVDVALGLHPHEFAAHAGVLGDRDGDRAGLGQRQRTARGCRPAGPGRLTGDVAAPIPQMPDAASRSGT